MSLGNCSKINPWVDIHIWSYFVVVRKGHFLPIVFIIWLYITCANICKITSENHETTPLVHLLVKLKGIWVKLCILEWNETTTFIIQGPKLTSCFFQCFITRRLLITTLRYLVFFKFLMDLLRHVKHDLSISYSLNQVSSWKRLLFHMVVAIIWDTNVVLSIPGPCDIDDIFITCGPVV